MTKTHGLPSARADSGHEKVWRPAALAARDSDCGPHDVSGLSRDDTTLMHEAAKARTALREAAAALTEAATHAHSLAALLEEAHVAPAEREPAVQIPSPPTVAPRVGGALSPREQEVLTLVAAGRTNKAIAEALFVSPNTIKTHVASLLHKLDADTRVQLAAIATTHGLRHRRAPASR